MLKKIFIFSVLGCITILQGSDSFSLFIDGEPKKENIHKEVKHKEEKLKVFSLTGIFEEACFHGDGRSCLNISNVYATTQGGEKNVIKALYYRTKACVYGEKKACNKLSSNGV